MAHLTAWCGLLRRTFFWSALFKWEGLNQWFVSLGSVHVLLLLLLLLEGMLVDSKMVPCLSKDGSFNGQVALQLGEGYPCLLYSFVVISWVAASHCQVNSPDSV